MSGNSHRVLCVALLASIQLATSSQAQAQTLEDGDFSLWTFGTVGGGGGTAAREATGGNPGARLRITTNAPFPSTNTVTAIKQDFVTNNPFQGAAFSLSIDFLSGPGAIGAGQAILVLVQQGSSIYGLGLGVTGLQSSWTTLTFNGTFDQASFSLISGPGGPNPDFTSGVPSSFGFAGQNSDTPSPLTNFYDNYRLTTTAVPEPATVTVLLLGAGLLGVCRKLRR